jgi:flagellar biosynthesis protein FlhA
MPLILEAIAEVRAYHAAPEMVCEHVRQRLGFQIVAGLRRADGTLPLIQLAPEWEKRFQAHTLEHDRGLPDVALPPEDFNRLAAAIAERYARIAGQADSPALVTSTRRRRFLKTVVATRGLQLPVLSFEEIGLDAKPAVLAVVAA